MTSSRGNGRDRDGCDERVVRRATIPLSMYIGSGEYMKNFADFAASCVSRASE